MHEIQSFLDDADVEYDDFISSGLDSDKEGKERHTDFMEADELTEWVEAKESRSYDNNQAMLHFYDHEVSDVFSVVDETSGYQIATVTGVGETEEYPTRLVVKVVSDSATLGYHAAFDIRNSEGVITVNAENDYPIVPYFLLSNYEVRHAELSDDADTITLYTAMMDMYEEDDE